MIDWLRPEWLLALPAGLALLWAWWRARAGLGPWRRVVDPALLEALASHAPASGARLALGLGIAVLVLACAALAGPTWRTQPVALQRDAGARVVVLDLSPSMNAVDMVPSRLERAREAVADLLRDAAGAQLGLVVFGGDAFSVAPLTLDAATLVHLLAGAAPRTLPRAGSRPDLGLELARAMLADSGAAGGEVILVADGAGDARTESAARALGNAGFPVSVLAVGTAHGGPVRVGEGAFARTEAGEVLVARPDFRSLERVASAGGGRFQLLPLAGATPRFARGARAWGESRATPAGSGDVRQDDGAWFALLALPFAALLFRRGWLACLAAFTLTLALPPSQAFAFDWEALWRRPDQQAAQAFARGIGGGDEAALLAKLGADSPWRALILYRAGRHAEAEALFAMHDTADAHYNRGNALALAGRLEPALEAYAAALERSPNMRDALHNRALVREALAKQRSQAAGGDDAQSPGDARAKGPSAAGSEAARGRKREPAWEEPDLPRAAQARSPQPAPQPRDDSPGEAELRRLEQLLAKVPDDPGSLLANRFAHQLRQRGAVHNDTGARW
ncbi:MAG TPA: VWA domain-containing protein [Burkholderiales bacterium]